MKLESNAFKDESSIPRKYTCQGADISPELHWSGAPENTKSFALIVDDPDAPAGTWIHWLICDIDSNIDAISENSVPPGSKQVRNDFGKRDYGGPCPPSGKHRYFFRLHALDVPKLNNVDQDNFYDVVDEHSIEKAILMGTYKKT